MATVGLLATRELIPRAKRAGNFSANSPTRLVNLAFASFSVVGYSSQLGLAVALLAETQSAGSACSIALTTGAQLRVLQ
jgi:hypothetical protein